MTATETLEALVRLFGEDEWRNETVEEAADLVAAWQRNRADTFTLEIETANAAYHPTDSSFPVAEAEEIGSNLLTVSQRLARGEKHGNVRDFNGNTVGSWVLR